MAMSSFYSAVNFLVLAVCNMNLLNFLIQIKQRSGAYSGVCPGGGLSPHSHPLNTPLADVAHSDTYFVKIVKIKTNVI